MSCPVIFTSQRLPANETSVLGCSATVQWIKDGRITPDRSLLAAACRACMARAKPSTYPRIVRRTLRMPRPTPLRPAKFPAA